jgi:hypothetical protein
MPSSIKTLRALSWDLTARNVKVFAALRKSSTASDEFNSGWARDRICAFTTVKFNTRWRLFGVVRQCLRPRHHAVGGGEG